MTLYKKKDCEKQTSLHCFNCFQIKNMMLASLTLKS